MASFYRSLTPEQQTIHDALCDSHYLAGLKAGYGAAQYGDKSEEIFSALMASREGHLTGIKEARAKLLSDMAAADAKAGLV